MNRTGQTALGYEQDPIDRQSTNLDIKGGDIVQKPLLPLGGVCHTVLPLPPGLRLLDIKIHWWKKSQESPVVCMRWRSVTDQRSSEVRAE